MKNHTHHEYTAKIVGVVAAVVFAISVSQSAFAVDGTWTGATDNTWKTSTNWNASPYPGAASGFTSQQIATFDSTGSGTIDLGGTLNIKSIIFGVSSGDAGPLTIGDSDDTLNLTTAGSITVNAGVTNGITIGTAGGMINLGDPTASSYSFVNNGSGTLTVAGAVTTVKTSRDFPSVLTLDGSGLGVISGVLSNTAGPSGRVALTKVGSGTWTLSGANTYSGNTTVNAGTLKAGVATTAGVSGAFGIDSAVTMANVSGAILDITGFDTQIGSITGGGTTGGNVTLGTQTLTVGANNTNPAAYAGAISGVGGSLTKIGSGTQILSGANTYTGATTVKEGTLTLNRQTGSLAAASALTMGGGTFNMNNVGASGALSQSLGALSFTAGESTVRTTRTATQNQALTFSSLGTRTTGATANFVNGGGTNSVNNGFNLTGVAAGFIDQGTFYGGSAYAWMDAAGTFVRGINYGTDSGAATSGADTTLASVAHQQITGAISAQNTATFTTLNISGNNNFTLAGSQTVTVNGILKSGNTVGEAFVSGGTGLQAASGAELVIRTDGINDTLAISTPILANGSNALTKSGAGTLILSGANAYTGATTVNAGTLALGSSGALGTTGNITFGGGALQFSASNTTDYSARIKNSTAAVSLNTNAQAMSIGGVIDSTNTGGLTKSGAGVLTLSGANTYTGVTTANGGRLVLDYATNNPISTNPVAISNGTLDLKGKSVGATTETISSLSIGGPSGSVSTLTLDANGGDGVALTIGTFNTGGGSFNLIDLSSSASNSIVISSLGTGAAVANGLLMGGSTYGSRTASIVVRDSTGYGFAKISGADSGTLSRLATGTALSASNTSSTTNYFLTAAGTLTRSADLAYGTLTIDSTAGAITLDMGTFNNNPNSNQGRAILVTGANDVAIAGSGTLQATALISNYSSGTLSVSLNGGSSSLQFGGSGFTDFSGSINGGAQGFGVAGGIVRLSKDQTIPATFNSGYYVSGGGVMEIGADLNGATAGDLSNALGATGFRFIGDSGLSAAGTSDRVVNFGGASSQITWGSAYFLTEVDGITDGGYTLKLSSAKADKKLTIQNSIALGTNTNRVIDVANGTAATDATLSGVLSGNGATLTKQGAGTLELSAANTYTGATTVSAGTLLINGSTAAGSEFSVNGGTLGGSGTIGGTVTLNSSSTLSPGNSPGTLSTGAQTWLNNANYNWQLLDAAGIAGTGYDTVAITGGLNLTGLTGSPDFNINLWTLASTGPDVNGNAVNFIDGNNYTWKLVSTTAGITGFNAANFTINTAAANGTSGFSNTFTGSFSVAVSGNDLNLLYTAVPEPSTWALLAFSLTTVMVLRRRRQG